MSSLFKLINPMHIYFMLHSARRQLIAISNKTIVYIHTFYISAKRISTFTNGNNGRKHYNNCFHTLLLLDLNLHSYGVLLQKENIRSANSYKA